MISKQTAEEYSKYMKKYPEFYETLADIVKNNIPKSVDEPFIVDLGVGPGLLSAAMNRKIPMSKIVGVDPSEDMLRLANENARLKTMIGSSENIPVEDNSVDIVVSRFNLTYWEKTRDSFGEIFRVLKPSGRVIIEALNRDFPRWKLFAIKTRMILNPSNIDVAKYHADAYKTAYSIESVRKLLTDSNFKITKVDGDKKDWKFTVIAEKK